MSETTLGSFEHLVGILQQLPLLQARPQNTLHWQETRVPQFRWRGQADADWPVQSTLFRALSEQYNAAPSEQQLRDAEQRLLVQSRQWGLNWRSVGGHLEDIELLALIQHNGGPTRLIDFSRNVLVALWFAVRDKTDRDARLIACDTSYCSFPSTSSSYWWGHPEDHDNSLIVDDLERPWGGYPAYSSSLIRVITPPVDERITRQAGEFIAGRIPAGAGKNDNSVEIKFSNLEAELIQVRQGGARPPVNLSFRIPSLLKVSFQEALSAAFGIDHATLFPDISGFCQAMDVKDLLSGPLSP